MKIIFLDCDGVLNSFNPANPTQWKELQILYSNDIERITHPIFKQHMDPLNRIIQETGAKLVITSTWRRHFRGIKALQIHLDKHGLKGKIIGHTPHLINGIRGEEINLWLRSMPTITEKQYIILDDDSDFLPEQSSRFIKTKTDTGLTEELADQAISLLKG